MGFFDRFSSKPPSKDDFAKLVMDRIHQAGEKNKIVYEPEEFRLRGEGKQTAALYLANAYQEYCTAPDDVREKVLKHWVRNWFSVLKEAPEEFEDAKHDLMPVARSRWHFESTALQGEVEGGVPTSWLCRSAKLPPLCSAKLPCYLERRRGLPSSK